MPVHHIAVLAFFLSLALVPPATAQAEDIDWLPVERAALVEKVRLDASVEAVQESTVSAQTAGTIMALPFDVDDRVEQGALIARLEDTEQRSRLRQAEGNLEEAEASLLDARQQFERIESLYQQDVASRSDFDEARNRLDGARARFVRAEAAVAEAREQLDYTRVEAPYTGVVTERHVEVGESVRPGQPLLSGFSLDELRVVAGVPQRYVEHARNFSRLTVSMDNGRTLPVMRMTVFPFADAQSHSIRLRLYLEERTDGIVPGMLVRVDLAAGQREAHEHAGHDAVSAFFQVQTKANAVRLSVGKRKHGHTHDRQRPAVVHRNGQSGKVSCVLDIPLRHAGHDAQFVERKSAEKRLARAHRFADLHVALCDH